MVFGRLVFEGGRDKAQIWGQLLPRYGWLRAWVRANSVITSLIGKIVMQINVLI